MRSREERLAYGRGYNVGRRGEWPREIAVSIPEAAYRDLVQASGKLSDRVDAFLAQLDDRETEPILVEIDEARDLVREACSRALEAVVAGGVSSSTPWRCPVCSGPHRVKNRAGELLCYDCFRREIGA